MLNALIHYANVWVGLQIITTLVLTIKWLFIISLESCRWPHTRVQYENTSNLVFITKVTFIRKLNKEEILERK